MNILLLANRDIASLLALNTLLPNLSQHSITLWLSNQVGKGVSPVPQLAQLDLLERQVLPDILLPMARKMGSPLSDFNALSERYTLRYVSSINDAASIDSLQSLAPDLIISIRFGLILRPAAIASARLGVLNLHSGILPDYRGVMATFHAMSQKEQYIGTTLHWIEDAGIDSGEILAIDRKAVNYQRSYLSNLIDIYPEGIKSILSAVSALQHGKRPASVKPSGQGQYFGHPDAEHMARFTQRGLALFDIQEINHWLSRWKG